MKMSELRKNRALFYGTFALSGIIALIFILTENYTLSTLTWVIPAVAKMFFIDKPDEREKIMSYKALANSPYLLIISVLLIARFVKDPEPRQLAILAVFLVWMGGTNLYVILRDQLS